MSVIKFDANFEFTNCDIESFKATVCIDIPDNLNHDQIDIEKNLKGVSIDFTLDEMKMTILSPLKIDVGTIGIKKIDVSDDDNDLFDDIMSNINVKIDTHWNCYCKIINVCGCGCDKLHDGW